MNEFFSTVGPMFSQIMQTGLYYLDAVLIAPYRLFPASMAGYLFGTFLLAFSCVFIGQITIILAWKMNRSRYGETSREMIRMHNLSLSALAAKDKSAYKACNSMANDAFGKFYFSHIAMGMASLWPAPFALGWMDMRFGSVDFPLIFSLPAVGYTFSFIPLYVLAYILFGQMRRHIPFFIRAARQMEEDQKGKEEMLSLVDLVESGGQTR